MKKLISRRKFLAAMGTMAAAGALTACGGSSSGHCFLCCRFQYGCLCCGELG